MTQHIEAEWRYEIQYGPEGEANYAWLYRGNEMVATMKTHHAVSLSAALAAAEERGRMEERERVKILLEEQIMSSVDWQEMSSAPKDGSMLRLLVNPDQDEFTAFDDSLTPYETIGFNNLENTQEDRWEFAGWDWSQDCFITGRGEVIGWSEMSPKPDGSKAPFVEPVVCVGMASIEKLLRGETVDTGRTILVPASDLAHQPAITKEPTP